jgi:hypothetical protein
MDNGRKWAYRSANVLVGLWITKIAWDGRQLWQDAVRSIVDEDFDCEDLEKYGLGGLCKNGDGYNGAYSGEDAETSVIGSIDPLDFAIGVAILGLYTCAFWSQDRVNHVAQHTI